MAKEQLDEMIEVIRQAAAESRMINEVEGDMEMIAQIFNIHIEKCLK